MIESGLQDPTETAGQDSFLSCLLFFATTFMTGTPEEDLLDHVTYKEGYSFWE